MADESTLRGFRPKHVSWLTIVLALLAIGTFLAISRPGIQYAVPMGIGGGMMEYGEGYTTSVPVGVPDMPMRDGSVSNVSGSSQGMMAPDMYYPDEYPYPYYNQNVPVTDTREFLKVNYNASMQTRDVHGLTRRVETTVRGYEGRIDQESSSPQYGYVSFVVPRAKYEAFRDELEGLVDSRFLTVNVSSQNLLPQKQSIEEQQTQADSALADYKAARQKIVNAHASTIKSLQSQIVADAEELVSLRAQIQTPQIQAQIQAVYDEWSLLNQQLANENASYSSQLRNADANIAYAEKWQTAVATQDQALLDNVETVTGFVSLQWISLWTMAQLYLPGYWIPTIFAVLAFLSYLWDRRRFAVA
ncbi:MAG: hypothetical protein UY39_C0003G0014 [Candidatus Kaiserbacteria bacterium GW2011_GWC2_49_12]|uniref:DUF4349 domain-containing protein n=4 Tax=Candidatus Kaiseribacteriota TaxID=1752734 RepID=A0A0G1WH52_9BACT|nr:MAG: hypothetical protein UY39_C0003G0014 [Candidatus Kaiserbacteria bacterium GW2011_GWC2_49_12]KKW17970.1 MAG: hypothetical protein UY57_C0005G0020 [Candidatus Kaiserbacteria bacterium GW2011_GWB1_50_17]KKW18640.1 MAG: hypothetical protein UY59_C0001G0011 [Candidatus Kaiserbacteria bacterium GW2011_GWA1_50_28]OGG87433.1 MAG: hypothetical protein A3H15_02940 [Candidatus Kaiserbacteria bacterium RIFCSPLOWO2_12_FULL_50_28]HCM43520.1 hypothetical protein [Candidatus Kaiserbacteria bacterium]